MQREQRQQELREGARRAILEAQATLAPEVRRRAFDGGAEPGPIADYVTTVAQRAWQVDDDLVAAARAAGLDDDGLFELTVAAAIGQATRQIDAALAALDDALKGETA